MTRDTTNSSYLEKQPPNEPWYGNSNNRSSSESRHIRRTSTRNSFRSTRSGYSVRDIYGDAPEYEIALQREKTREEVLAQGTITRGIDDIVVPEVPDGVVDDGESLMDIDPELVTWDGDDDPDNPRNWPKPRKWLMVFIVSLYTFMSPLASSILSPAIDDMSAELHITQEIEQNLSVSIFVLAWAICPLFVAPLSEIFGRKIVLNTSIVLLVIFNMASALSKNTAQLLVFRFLAGCSGAPPLSIGGGTLADLFNDEDRNAALAYYSFGPTVGPVIAPIIAGFITENAGWRWVLWVLTIATGFSAAFGAIFYRETYAPVLLKRKAEKLRKETGNPHLHTIFELTSASFRRQLYTAVTRPIRLVFLHPIVTGLGLYLAFVYGFMYLLIVAFPILWTNFYGYNVGISGLMYVAWGVGFCIGLPIWATVMQRLYLYQIKKNGGVARPEFRLPLLPICSVFLGVGLFWYGWSAEAHLMWLMPCIGVGIFASAIVGVFQGVQNYLIDMNPRVSASSLAAAQVFRSYFGFGFPLFGQAMYNKLGFGWASSISGIIIFILGMPFPIFVFFYGERLRTWANKRFDVDLPQTPAHIQRQEEENAVPSSNESTSKDHTTDEEKECI